MTSPKKKTKTKRKNYKTPPGQESRWLIYGSVSLALLVLAAGGGDLGLGQEELPAGTHAHLEETLGVSGNPFSALRQARHAHRLGVQHQLRRNNHTDG